VRKRIVFLPQCAFNSYLVHPLHPLHFEEKRLSEYVSGDFIMHLAGFKFRTKKKLLQKFLTS
jgi:hypothetical protein